MFFDWLNVSQQFEPDAYPDFNGGQVVSVDGACGFGRARVVDQDTGEISDAWAFSGSDDVDYATAKFQQHRGSYETAIMIRLIGGRLEVRGNPSAWGRLDNLFGVGLDDGIEVYNDILSSLGLPCFTEGVERDQWMQESETWAKTYTGAHITRADVTENNAVGMGRVSAYHKWVAGQKIYRTAPDDEQLQKFACWNFDTVYTSLSKMWVNVKHYDKSKALEERTLPEYLKKLKKSARDGKISKAEVATLYREAEDYLLKLAEWCAELGVTRSEWSFRSRWFTQHKGAGWWKPVETEEALFGHAQEEREKLVNRGCVYQEQDFDSLSNKEFRVLEDWKRGTQVRESMTKPTFYRLRSAILEKTGYDIAARPLNIVNEQRPVYFQVRRLSISDAPVWYQRPAYQFQLAA